MTPEPHVEQVIQDNPETAADVPLSIGQDEEVFLMSIIDVETVDQLKTHIFRVQAEAAEVIEISRRFMPMIYSHSDLLAGVPVSLYQAV